jgi:hypothetical protein
MSALVCPHPLFVAASTSLLAALLLLEGFWLHAEWAGIGVAASTGTSAGGGGSSALSLAVRHAEFGRLDVATVSSLLMGGWAL